MISLCFEQKEVFKLWLAKRLKMKEVIPGSTTITVLSPDSIRAVMSFSMFNGTDCWVSIASDGYWMNKQVCSVVPKYVFDQLGCTRASIFVREDNVKTLRYVERLGFKREGLFRKYYENGMNCIALGILKEECKWR